jgi:hypothetical protein
MAWDGRISTDGRVVKSVERIEFSRSAESGQLSENVSSVSSSVSSRTSRTGAYAEEGGAVWIMDCGMDEALTPGAVAVREACRLSREPRRSRC